ncbi:MAG: GNAT family N-acetyltransferase [Pikeienuella sp.]|uniref:GNAT family N-acetyltransferase n=1 Tax=Pikeienuella sp. TaxID=2831957 RepID=UPI00391A14CA
MRAGVGEFFGNEAQQGLQRRAAHLWSLIGGDPRFASHGRAVGLAEFHPDNLGLQVALARLQGVGPQESVPTAELERLRLALEAEGLVVDSFVDWRGDEAALDAARALLAARSLPEDLEIVSVDAETPAEDLAALDRLTQSCGVLLPMGAFLRGLRRPSICLFARDRAGAVVGATASVMQFHPASRKAGLAWWGMLATDERRRGQGIAIVMGAMSLLAMNERFGTSAFFTGIREGNEASEALCARLGFAPTEAHDVIAVDPAVLSGGRLTK